MAASQMRVTVNVLVPHMLHRPQNVLFSQKAVEDLQFEEEKVNLLTKEKAKLQVYVEEVSTATFMRPYPLILM